MIIPQDAYWRSAPPSAYVIDSQRVSSFPLRAIDRITLREGLLEPGSHAVGYVYFSRYARRPGRLRLVWDARTKEGDRVAVLSLEAELPTASSTCPPVESSSIPERTSRSASATR